jgi:hypothetical protein
LRLEIVEAQAHWLALIVVGHDRIPLACGSRGFVFMQPLFSFLPRLLSLPLLSRAFFLPFSKRRASCHENSLQEKRSSFIISHEPYFRLQAAQQRVQLKGTKYMPLPMVTRVFSQAALLLILSILSGAQAAPQAAAAGAGTIACRALETHTDDALKVTVVVFHQRDEAQRSQLATLLHAHSGVMVEVQAGDGTWRRARLVRLKSCFGRGLLMLPAPAPFSDHAEFALRLPADVH